MFSVLVECFKHIIAVQQHNKVFIITFVLVWLVLRFQVFLHYFAKQSLSRFSQLVIFFLKKQHFIALNLLHSNRMPNNRRGAALLPLNALLLAV